MATRREESGATCCWRSASSCASLDVLAFSAASSDSSALTICAAPAPSRATTAVLPHAAADAADNHSSMLLTLNPDISTACTGPCPAAASRCAWRAATPSSTCATTAARF